MNKQDNLSSPRALIVMGVSGCGKSTVAQELAKHYGYIFLDADDFHSEENKAHMAAGKPLTDTMRLPWIRNMQNKLQELYETKQSCVLAYSGLRAEHRDILRQTDMQTCYIFLKGSIELISKRMAVRADHFMPTSLLESQFASLQDPGQENDVLTVDISVSLEEVLEEIYNRVSSGERK